MKQNLAKKNKEQAANCSLVLPNTLWKNFTGVIQNVSRSAFKELFVNLDFR